MPRRPAEPLRSPAFAGFRIRRFVSPLEVGFVFPEAADAWSFGQR